MAPSEDFTIIEKLVDETSYQIWKFQIVVTFKAYELYEIVNGEKLFTTLENDQEKANWRKKDAKAQKLIVTTIDRKYMMHIIDCKNSKEMFEKIKSIFEKSTSDQICSLLQQFYSYSYAKGTDMTLHISKIENIAHKLKSLKQTVDENMIMSKILSTLPAEYAHFQTAWESATTDEKTLEKLTARLLAEETRNKNKESESKIAFESTERFCRRCKSKTHDTNFCKKGKEVRKCYKCGNTGHLARDCSEVLPSHHRTHFGSSGMNNLAKACSICKKTNHKEQDCFFRNKSKPNNNKIAFLTENENLYSQCFVVDSGSSSHMANSRDMFSDLENTSSSIQVAKKNENMKSEGKGSIEGSACVLKDVLFVPDLRKNLLSVNAITNNGGEVVFTKEKVLIKKNDKKILEGIKSDKGLYMVNLHETEESYLTQDKDKTEDWHRKLGHLGLNNMKKLIDLSTGITLNKSQVNELKNVCEVCLQAKQTRLPFNTVRQRASRCLEILHTDICGPIEPETWDGKTYMLTILDDYTHYSRIYLLRYKNEATEYLKEFIQEAETCQNAKVTKIRCDNGGEYANTNFRQWCKNKGIVLDFTIPYTPQHNGKAERLNRTLLEKARALIFDANINKEFWGEAVYVATYLLNRSPTETLEKTPIECWTGTKPDLSRLQIFGSIAYAKTLGYTQKLASRSKKYLFVGYALNGYRLWDETLRKIVVHRDVVFVKPEKVINSNKIQVKTEGQEVPEEREEEIEQEQIRDEVEPTQEAQKNYPGSGEGCNETRSGRKIKIPEKMKDYILDLEDESFLTYDEAISGPDKNRWKEAIQDEIESLNENQTWTYINKNEAQDKHILTSKWVFKIKDDGKYKARLVIRGCQQLKGIDYNETFSPVVNVSSLRILFALAVKNDMKISRFDIKTAFLYGNLSDEIYMQIPEGFDSEHTHNKICLLKKSLYGLKQSPLKWNEKFSNFLRSKGLITLKGDQCMFKNENQTLFLAIYVDDGIVLSKDQNELTSLWKNLKQEFKITVFEDPDMFLGIEIVKQPGRILLRQEKYTKSVLEKFNMQNAKPVATPLVSNDIEEGKNMLSKSYPYREAIGSLLYLTNKTRPEIAYAVNFCSRRMENTTDQDVINVKRLFRYLVSTTSDGITYDDPNSDKLIAFCDSDYAGDTETRKSTTGFIIFYCGGPISWGSRKQPIVSLSSTEAEYIAAADCVKELLYLKTIIDELTGGNIKIELFVDNQSAITIIKNGQFNRRSKHIDVRYHFIMEKVQEGIINLKYCATERQIADILTKPLGAVKFREFKGQFMSKN